MKERNLYQDYTRKGVEPGRMFRDCPARRYYSEPLRAKQL